MEGLAHRFGPAQQAHQAAGEVAGVGQDEEGVPSPGTTMGEAAPQAMDDGVVAAAGRGHPALAVGEGGSHDGGGEARVAVGLAQGLLGLDLLPGIVPVGVAERRLLGDPVPGGGFW